MFVLHQLGWLVVVATYTLCLLFQECAYESTRALSAAFCRISAVGPDRAFSDSKRLRPAREKHRPVCNTPECARLRYLCFVQLAR